MKSLLCLVALLALASLAARAQSGSNPYAPSEQTRQNQVANEEIRQRYLNDANQANQQQSTASTGGGGTNYREIFPTRAQRERNKGEREYQRRRKAEEKANDGWHEWPGGYWYKDGKIRAPDGTIESELSRPGRKH